MRRVLAVAALATALLAQLSDADAQCTDRKNPSQVKRAINLANRCNERMLRKGPAVSCLTATPPGCAGSLAADAVALGSAPIDPPPNAIDTAALRAQLRCQSSIGKGIAAFTFRKLRALLRGRTPEQAQAEARVTLERLTKRCAVPVARDPSGVTLPAVGPQCAAAVGEPGTIVNTTALRDCLVTLLGVWGERVGPSPQPLRPNILFILTDDQRWDTTDATHSPSGAFIMPGTRAELGRGAEFTDAFVTTPLCCPSRSSILQGSYAHRTGVYRNGGTNGGADDFADASTLATWLEGAGYRTSLIGKYLNGYPQLWTSPEIPYIPPGWTEWRGLRNVAFFDYQWVEPDGAGGYVVNQYGDAPEDYLTDVMREKAKTFISASVAADAPFFLYLAFKAPHLPQIPAPRHEGMFQNLPPWRPPSWNEEDVTDKPTWVQNTPLMTPNRIAGLDQIRIDQLEMLQAVDEAIGGSTTFGITGIMQHLRDLGIEENTIVVFLADNGWYWGEHRLRAKNNPYEEAIRAPMFVHYPKLIPLPRTEDRFALNIDLAPTFAELAGAAVPIAHDGASLVRVLDGTAPSWRQDFLTEGWPASHPWATVREAQWKYTEIPVTPGDPATLFERELYDLVSDPLELQNVAGDPAHAARIAAMAARLRVLRPNWPVDSDAGGDDPPEDPDDD
jgi:N-acetylglucosamine-6-sulfatase